MRLLLLVAGTMSCWRFGDPCIWISETSVIQLILTKCHHIELHRTEDRWKLRIKRRDSSVGITLGNGLDDRGSRVRFPAGAGNFSLTTASRTALGPTHPPIQRIPGALSLRVKQPGREPDHSPPSSAEVKKCMELYLHFPIRFHGVVLS
jgi:hypothetical protein